MLPLKHHFSSELDVFSLESSISMKRALSNNLARSPCPPKSSILLGNVSLRLSPYPSWWKFKCTRIDGWSLLGGNQFVKPQRLAKLGWEPVETKKLSLLDSLPRMIDVALEESVDHLLPTSTISG